MNSEIWKECIKQLKCEYSEGELDTWIKPLQSEYKDNMLFLLAPNRFVVDWVKQNFLERINEIINEFYPKETIFINIEIGSKTLKNDVVRQNKLNNNNTKTLVDNFVDKASSVK